VEIVIYDLLGHKIMDVMTNTQHQEGEYILQLDVSGIRSGIYLCRISTLEGMLSTKLIIQ
ncbi:MAG: T9SS type A sorting domain-containing protein, partial [Bacteroidetes bacterium]|nr:T9SS type A sorting domain-containing protein [Bacteroidota bacterium]